MSVQIRNVLKRAFDLARHAMGPDSQPPADTERLTAFGRWLRATRLDELPNLWKVQIREGQITRQEALMKVEDENRPRYANIKWYLDAIGMDFESTIRQINAIPRMYQESRM